MESVCETPKTEQYACLVKKIGPGRSVIGTVTVVGKTIVQSAIDASERLGCGEFEVWIPNATCAHTVMTREETRIVVGPLRDASCEVD